MVVAGMRRSQDEGPATESLGVGVVVEGGAGGRKRTSAEAVRATGTEERALRV